MDAYIDIYCERTGPGLWAEPLNTLSNLAFFIAAFAAWRMARRRGGVKLDSGLLIGLVVLIGAGSTAFHMLANRWSALADVLPILFYQLAFLAIYARKAMRLSALSSALLVAAYLAVTWLFGLLPRDWLNGSLSYGPALLFLFGLGAYHYSRDFPARATLLAAAGVFALSLVFRSVDMWVCPALSAGVHSLWHLLNAVVLFLTLQALLTIPDRRAN